MCGIALIVSGIRIDSSSMCSSSHEICSSLDLESVKFHVKIDDLKAALRRRGPDSLGAKKVFVELKDASDTELLSYVVGDEETEQENFYSLTMDGENEFGTPQSIAEMYFIGAVLQLRGTNTVLQPLIDASRNVLIYNGEIFGGIHMSSDSNDTEVLMWSLGNCCCCHSHCNMSSCGGIPVPVLLSSIKGPWTVVYWQNASRTLWFGRDAFGRRSLVVHWPTPDDSRLILSSVSAQSSVAQSLGTLQPSTRAPAHMVLDALRKSITRRTSKYTIFKAGIDDAGKEYIVPVAVLFSGGLDSMILAAILHECLDARCGIDLLNVSFEGEAAPDRITARAGVKELRRIAPLRKWRLVEIDASLSNLTMEMMHVTSLINPAKTYMDLNIGIALWLAAGGDGWVYETDNFCEDDGCKRFRHKSEARILLVGSGADEQCAGYGRHRTKYRNSSWFGLNEEMKLDMQRIWKRNLGRDDRCIADNGKEARFPFLDEDVIRILLDFPLWQIANLDQPSGTGDKKILREVARLLGLHEAAVQPKRAIQFGSRIAQESNRRNFGSNRAANQASAGSAVIHK